jgi:ribosomal protein S18 acetylase RimI-like enzyme
MPRFTLEDLRRMVTGEARARGADVRVAERDGEVVGCAGWVARDSAFFISPLIAADGEVAGTLVDACCEVAGGAAWMRAFIGARRSPIADVLVERGFVPHSESVTLARATAPDTATPIPGWIALPDVDLDRLLALDNATFRDVPNSLPTSRAELDEVLEHVVVDATGVVERDRVYVGFVVVDRELGDEPHASINAIGVADAVRRQGLATALVRHAIAGAHRAGFAEIRALVSSLNPASMALHAGLGFTPKYRRYVWQRDL